MTANAMVAKLRTFPASADRTLSCVQTLRDGTKPFREKQYAPPQNQGELNSVIQSCVKTKVVVNQYQNSMAMETTCPPVLWTVLPKPRRLSRSVVGNGLSEFERAEIWGIAREPIVDVGKHNRGVYRGGTFLKRKVE